MFRRIIFIISFMVTSSFALAQEKDSTYVGSVKGIVRDSVHNYTLPSATVAVYFNNGSDLIAYQLSNKFGEFLCKGLPIDKPLKLIVSYIGYTSYTTLFLIPGQVKTRDLKNLNIKPSNQQLNEVKITAIPPVRMNGDTLEFNADAFKLNPNAVVEDLLRKLPGINIWGDGTITVNGKKVQSLLVEGKPFFGNDPRIATQNIAKNAIDKVQVYRKSIGNENLTDSTMEVNIKLKKGMRKGYFGKIGIGYGSTKKREIDGNINFYSQKTQIGVVIADNNTNKTASNVQTLIRNASFKGVSASVEYNPDFTIQGIHKQRAGGFTLLQDLNSGTFLLNQLSANYFGTNKNSDIQRTDIAIIALNETNNLTQNSTSQSNSNNIQQQAHSSYKLKNKGTSIYINPEFNSDKSKITYLTQSSSSSTMKGLQSYNSNNQEQENYTRKFKLATGYTYSSSKSGKSYWPNFLQIEATFSSNQVDTKETNKTEFISISDPSQSKAFNRKYDKETSNRNETINFNVKDLKKLLFNENTFPGLTIDVQNNLILNQQQEKSKVIDLNPLNDKYTDNIYLTNNTNNNILNNISTLNINKVFYKTLYGRYDKSWAINLGLRGQIFNQENRSQKTFQNYNKNNQAFIPYAEVSYINKQNEAYTSSYSLKYITSKRYPTAEQLVPLTDSIKIWYLNLGNPYLEPEFKQEISFQFHHSSSRVRNTFFYQTNVTIGKITNLMADSNVYHPNGSISHYQTNLNGNKYVSISGVLNKAFKINENLLQIELATAFTITKVPGYTNNILNLSSNFNNNNKLTVAYSYKNILAIDFFQDLSFFRSKRINTDQFGYKFSNMASTNGLSASLNCTETLVLNSNINYRINKFTGADDVSSTIWNANVSQRVLKGNNLEFKLSALDLLRQNKGIISYGNNNSITNSTINSMKQYFMLSIAYFPRKFGKSNRE